MKKGRTEQIISWLEHNIYQNKQYGLGSGVQTSMYQSIITLIRDLENEIERLEAKDENISN